MSISPETLFAIAEEAGSEILRIYGKADLATVEYKADNSPLTEADRSSHAIIVESLQRLTPNIPIVSEEDSNRTRPSGPFWLVDPLDGTKEFVKRTGEFTVNIALIERGIPVSGVVHAPALSTTWLTTSRGAERWHKQERRIIGVTRQVDISALRIVASRDHAGAHLQSILARLPSAVTLSMGSSLKFCLVAEGLADLYFRDGPTMPWDTAAAHAVLRAAGGDVYGLNEKPLLYSDPYALNPHFFAVGSSAVPWTSILLPSIGK
jgi:3'(2'), 5'-bisphosphate nucleotidase